MNLRGGHALRALLAGLTAICASGCDGKTGTLNPIDVRDISPVVSEIKREVRDYETAAQAWRRDPASDPALANLQKNPSGTTVACGRGVVDFDISQIKMDLTTSLDVTTGGGLGVTIPLVGPPTGSVGLGVNASTGTLNTQGLTFYSYPIFPISDVSVSPGSAPQYGPITRTLIALRTALSTAAATPPCFDAIRDAAKDPENTITLGIAVTNAGGGKGTLTLAVVNASINQDRKSITGNTITISYKPLKGSSQWLEFLPPGSVDVR